MTATTHTTVIRRATPADLPLLREAMDAMPYDVQAASSTEIVMALEDGSVQVFIMETARSVTVVGVQKDAEGTYGQFGALYRAGSPHGLISDCRALLNAILPVLAQDGVRYVGLMLQNSNPLHEKLAHLYNRLGFSPSAIQMTAEIGVRRGIAS